MDTLENAARRAEYWKAEHAAANKRITELEDLLFSNDREPNRMSALLGENMPGPVTRAKIGDQCLDITGGKRISALVGLAWALENDEEVQENDDGTWTAIAYVYGKNFGPVTGGSMKVRVMIAVAVHPSGAWESYGWKKSDEDKPEHAMELASDGCEDCALYWVEAELDVPPTRVSGSVST